MHAAAATVMQLRAGAWLLLLLSSAAGVPHGSFEGSVVRVQGDPVLAANATAVTAADLLCSSAVSGGATAAIEGGCGAPAEKWVALMLQGLRETHGACIAAPQVGISKRAILMSVPQERIREEEAGKVMPPAVLINPQLWPSADSETADNFLETWESCLSVPNKYVVVKRYKSIPYTGQRLDGTEVEGVARGRLALTLQVRTSLSRIILGVGV